MKLDNMGRAIALEAFYTWDLDERTRLDINMPTKERWLNECRDGAYMVCKERPDDVKGEHWQEWLWVLDIELASIW